MVENESVWSLLGMIQQHIPQLGNSPHQCHWSCVIIFQTVDFAWLIFGALRLTHTSILFSWSTGYLKQLKKHFTSWSSIAYSYMITMFQMCSKYFPPKTCVFLPVGHGFHGLHGPSGEHLQQRAEARRRAEAASGDWKWDQGQFGATLRFVVVEKMGWVGWVGWWFIWQKST